MTWITSDEYHVYLAGYSGSSTDTTTTAETCDAVNMGRYQSMMALIQVGGLNNVTTSALFMIEASTQTATGQPLATWNYRKASTAADASALSARAAGASTGITMISTAATMTIVEVKSDDLTEGFYYVRASVSSAAANRQLSVAYVMKPRYAQASMLRGDS